MGLFDNRETKVPVWFMRQAGRYHNHYQGFRKKHSFMQMCKDPELASEITMGPINDFNFDAAILFSDLLFPLEYLGMGLHYNDGPPKLAFHLNETKNIEKLNTNQNAKEFFNFQKRASQALRKKLPSNKNLIGFIGAPFTLYTYAVEGSHGGNLVEAKKGLYDGRFKAFLELLLPVIVQEAQVQIEGGADTIAIFDTAAGELSPYDYEDHVSPYIRELTAKIKASHPKVKIIYYSKFTHLGFLERLDDKNIDVLGIDWRHDLNKALEQFSEKYYIQGNMDPSWLFLPWDQLRENMLAFFKRQEDKYLSKWIFGLGHGVLPKVPQENVRNAVALIHEYYS